LEKAIQVRHLKRWTFTRLVRTDLLDRGVPWIALMLRDRRTVRDLNLTWSARISTLLSYSLVLSIAVLMRAAASHAQYPVSLALLPPGCLLAILGIHHDFYRFFASARGLRFAAAVVPLHLLYFLYSGLALPLGICAYVRDTRQALRWGAGPAVRPSRLLETGIPGVPPPDARLPSLAVVCAGPEGLFGVESQSP
jgi:hypothetical protein